MMLARKLDKVTIVLMCVLSIAVIFFAHKAARADKWYGYKIKAAKIMLEAETALAARKEELGLTPEPEISAKMGRRTFDIKKLGVMGFVIGRDKGSPVITTEGVLQSKLAAANPNFAAVMVEYLKEAGVNEGDTVAVAFSGSIPGANIAVLSAAEAMNLRPIIISSLGASTWGATIPEMTWLDMEKYLYDKKIFSSRSIAASLGGERDVQMDKSSDEKRFLMEIVGRNGIPPIYEENVNKSTGIRMARYEKEAAGAAIKAFINVGGDSAVVGVQSYRKYIPSGVFFDLDTSKFPRKAVIMLMSEKGIPVINIKNIRGIVRKYDMPLIPRHMPEIGEGKVFVEKKHNLVVGGVALAAEFLIFLVLINFDIYILPRMYKMLDIEQR